MVAKMARPAPRSGIVWARKAPLLLARSHGCAGGHHRPRAAGGGVRAGRPGRRGPGGYGRRLEELSGQRYVSPHHPAYVYTGLGTLNGRWITWGGPTPSGRARSAGSKVVPVHAAPLAPLSPAGV